MKSVSLSVVAALAALPSVVPAQQEPIPYREIRHARLDLATGEVVDLGPWQGAGALDGAASTFANTAATGLYVPTFQEEWLDWGYKDSGGATGPVCSFDVAYGTKACDDPPSGPVTLEVAFFSGTLGGCVQGFEVARFTLAGLPGDTDCTDGFGTAWIVTVDLDLGSFFLPDGAIGWSYAEVGTDGSTGPLLVTPSFGTPCFQPFPPAPGTSDCFDRYSPAGSGTCVEGSVSFGVVEPLASFYLELFEETGSPSSVAPRTGTPPNPGAMASSSPPVLGGAYDPAITADAVAAPAVDFCFVTLAPSSPLTGVPSGFGTLLVDPASFVAAPSQPSGGAFSIPIPVHCVLIGASLFAQCGQVDAGGVIGLTNAEDIVLGTL